jgi:hypothetical protein
MADLEWSPQRLIRWGETVGQSCAAVIVRILETRPHPEQGHRAMEKHGVGLLMASREWEPPAFKRLRRR